jgi:hypothetical protein|tara:strand:- start:160 stop:615 length:456 start_codon:yes stop_codon:yes gene_type:complete
MKKILMMLMVSLGLQLQAQTNLCDSLTASGTQSQFTIEINGVNTFIDYWVTTSSDSVVFQEDSMSIYQMIYNSGYDTLTTCITHANNTCCVTWIWDANMWLKMSMQPTSIEEYTTTEIVDNKMYDLYGRELLTAPIGQMYIQNRKKYIKLR